MAGPVTSGEANALSARARSSGPVEGVFSTHLALRLRRTARFAYDRPVRNFLALSPVVARVFIVYLLRCADGAVYVGHTENLEARIAAHNSGGAAFFTRNRRPVVIAYHENHSSHASAVAREHQIKRWTRAKKEALIAGDMARLKRL